MTKRQRTILFLLLGTVFFLFAPAIIFYSQGYRFDWDQKQFSQVGAFYFNVIPGRSEILVNDRSIGKTAHILGTILTKNFSPAGYKVQIQKEGYYTWEKRLEVFPRQVTEAKHITLLPINTTFVALQDNIQSLWFAPNKTEVLLKKSNSKNTWTLVLWDAQRNTEYPLYESARTQDEVWNIEWAPNSNAFVLQIVSQEQIKSFVQRIDRNLLERQRTAAESLQAAAQLRTSLISLGEAPKLIAFSPFQETELLFLTPVRNSFSLKQFDYTKGQTGNSLAQNVLTFFADAQQVLWLDQNGILWQETNRETPALAVNQKPMFIEKETPYKIFVFGNKFFIQEKETLYLFNPQTQTFEKLLSPFSEITLSPDGKKVALSSGKEIWLYFLEEEREQPSRSTGDNVFLTRFSEEITNLTWFGAHYLMFVKNEAIVVSEIDNRDHLNMVELATFSRPSFLWQDWTKTLLVHTRDEIRASEKLLP